VAEPSNPESAQLEFEDGSVVQCYFNPKEYSVTKNNTWNASPQAGSSLPKVQFGGGSPQELSFEILLDDMEGDNPIGDDLELLFKKMEADKKFVAKSGKKNVARPPYVTFSWGQTNFFLAAVKSLSVQFLKFDSSGTPIRAQVKLTLMQVDPGPPGQNPTTRAIPGLGSHTVRDGDSLQSIAYTAYGDATAWRAIAEANGIDDPMRLRRGTRLLIPVRDA
jgi:nucleoid-associated protein YgaU